MHKFQFRLTSILLYTIPIISLVVLLSLPSSLAKPTDAPTENVQTLAWKTSKQRQAAWAVVAIIVLFAILAVAVWKSGICLQVDDFRTHYSRSRGNSEPMTIGKLLRSMANSNANAAQYSQLGVDDDDDVPLPQRF